MHFPDRKYLLNKTIKVARLSRLIAKSIDLFVVFCFSVLFFPLGLVLGVLYLSLSDGLLMGQSMGKRFMGFSVKSLEDGSPCSYKQSIIRNLPITIPLFFCVIPFWGWLIGALLGLMLIGLEVYLLYNLDSGHRLGDVMADTSVMANDDNFVGLKKRKTSWFASNTTTSY